MAAFSLDRPINDENQQLNSLFLEKRSSLLDLTQKYSEVIKLLAIEGEGEKISNLIKRLQTELFKVLVIGEFSRGKSTFINALLHAKEEILPTDMLEATAVITEVKYAEEHRIVLHYKPEFIKDNQSTKEVPADRLEEYVKFKDSSSDDQEKEQEIRDNPYEKIELFWNLDLCKEGVAIVDSPGLNASDISAKITTQYVYQVDAIIFVLACNQLGTSEEIKKIKEINESGFSDIFFVCNFFDSVRTEQEKAKIKATAIKKIGSFTQLGGENEGIFFISARNAVEGYKEENRTKVEDSGILILEKALASFLSEGTIARSKLISSEKVLRQSIQKSRQTIPDLQQMLNTNAADLRLRYNNAEIQLKKKELDRQIIIRKVTNFREDLKDLVRNKTRQKIQNISNQMNDWLKDYEIKEPLNLISWDTVKIQSALERVVTEITTYLVAKVEAELKTWQKTELEPFLQNRLELITLELENSVREFVKEIDNIRVTIVYGNNATSMNIAVEESKISPLERILSAAGGWVFGDISSAMIGAAFGYKEMLKSLIPQLAIIGVTTLLVGWNPFVIISAVLAGGIVQGLFKMKGMNDKIKAQVGEKYIDELRASPQPDEMADKISNELKKFENLIDKGLENEINNVRLQTESAISTIAQGEKEVKEKLKQLNNMTIELNCIDENLNELMRGIAQL